MARRTMKSVEITEDQPTTEGNVMEVNRYDLQVALHELQRVAVTTGAVNPVTSFVHLSNDKHGGLRLAANDLEVGIVARLKGSTLALNQDAILSAKVFSKLVKGAKKTSKEVVKIEVQKWSRTSGPRYVVGKDSVGLTVDGMTTKLTPDNTPDNFPDPEASVGGKIDDVEVVDIVSLRRSLEYVIPAASNDATRYNLNGVLLDFEDHKMVTTDGHRLHMGLLDVRTPDLELFKKDMHQVLVPKLFAEQVARVLKHVDDTVPAMFSLHKMDDTDYHLLRFDVVGKIGWTIMCRVIDSQFPEYKNVVPTKKHCLNMFEIKRDTLVKVCKRMIVVYGNDGQPGGTFALKDDNKLDVMVSRPENEASTTVDVLTLRKHEGTVKIEVDDAGHEIEVKKYHRDVRANFQYVLQAVNEKVHDEVVVYFGEDLDPLLFDNGEGFEGVVMPLRK